MPFPNPNCPLCKGKGKLPLHIYRTVVKTDEELIEYFLGTKSVKKFGCPICDTGDTYGIFIKLDPNWRP
jgi:hypothetical protein